MQLPGRNMRSKEAPLTSCQAVAQALLPVVASKLAGTPYIVRFTPEPSHALSPQCCRSLLAPPKALAAGMRGR